MALTNFLSKGLSSALAAIVLYTGISHAQNVPNPKQNQDPNFISETTKNQEIVNDLINGQYRLHVLQDIKDKFGLEYYRYEYIKLLEKEAEALRAKLSEIIPDIETTYRLELNLPGVASEISPFEEGTTNSLFDNNISTIRIIGNTGNTRPLFRAELIGYSSIAGGNRRSYSIANWQRGMSILPEFTFNSARRQANTSGSNISHTNQFFNDSNLQLGVESQRLEDHIQHERGLTKHSISSKLGIDFDSTVHKDTELTTDSHSVWTISRPLIAYHLDRDTVIESSTEHNQRLLVYGLKEFRLPRFILGLSGGWKYLTSNSGDTLSVSLAESELPPRKFLDHLSISNPFERTTVSTKTSSESTHSLWGGELGAYITPDSINLFENVSLDLIVGAIGDFVEFDYANFVSMTGRARLSIHPDTLGGYGIITQTGWTGDFSSFDISDLDLELFVLLQAEDPTRLFNGWAKCSNESFMGSFNRQLGTKERLCLPDVLFEQETLGIASRYTSGSSYFDVYLTRRLYDELIGFHPSAKLDQHGQVDGGISIEVPSLGLRLRYLYESEKQDTLSESLSFNQPAVFPLFWGDIPNLNNGATVSLSFSSEGNYVNDLLFWFRDAVKEFIR